MMESSFLLLVAILQHIPLGASFPSPSKIWRTQQLKDRGEESFKVLAVGGWSDVLVSNGAYLSDVEYFDPYSDAKSSTKFPDYPVALEDQCGSGNIFCGGWDGSKSSNQCWELVETSWVERTNLIDGRYRSSCAQLSNNSFWMVGGYSDDSTKTLSSSEMIIDQDSTSQNSVELPENMYGHCMAWLNDTHLFTAGTGAGRDVYLVDTTQDEFSFKKLKSLHVQRFSPGCGVVHNLGPKYEDDWMLIVAGGAYGSVRTSSEIYSPKTRKWDHGPTLPRGFHRGGSLSDSDHPLLLIGGWDEHANERSDVMEYVPDTNTFEYLPGKLNIARHNFAVTGGYDSNF